MMQREDLDESELPIYRLINYDSSGLLLDYCREIVFPEHNLKFNNGDNNKKKSKISNNITTFGYQTQESDKSKLKVKSSKSFLIEQKQNGSSHSKTKELNNNNVIQLFWWQLIELDTKVPEEVKSSLELIYKSRLIHFCSIISDLVG